MKSDQIYLRHFNGKGYATAAVSLCVKIAVEQLRLHRVQAGVMPSNTPSIRVTAEDLI